MQRCLRRLDLWRALAVVVSAMLAPSAPSARTLDHGALNHGTPDRKAGNWGWERSGLTSTPEYALSKAICRRLADLEPPARDEPTPAQAGTLAGCSSEKPYYGEGVAPDAVEARLCAFTQGDAGDDVFSGSTILMQIYANGMGVPRNLDLATAYACRIGGAPAEIDGRVRHIQAMRTRAGRLDFCDDITSGWADGVCRSRASAQAAIGRDARLASVVARLPPAARVLFAPMKQAFDAFVAAHGDGEVDQSGTARAAMEIAEQGSVRDQFARNLGRLQSGTWPAATAATTADNRLNASYRRARAWAAGKDNDGTVRPEAIRKAQRAWLAYRDAFIRFAAVTAPATARDAVLARLTGLRTAELDQLDAP